jgi:hypothetical protein
MSGFPLVLTVEAAAERLVTTPEKLVAELEAGRLEGFRIGDEWRTTETALIKFMGVCASVAQERGPPMTTVSTNTARESLDFDALLADVDWRPVDPFEYQWPKRKTEPDKRPEFYEEAYAARFMLESQEVHVLIGFCNRESAGDKERRRAVIFLGQHPGNYASEAGFEWWLPSPLRNIEWLGGVPRLYPLVEFSGENSEAFAITGRMASIIKLPSGQHLRPGDAVPAEYAVLNLAIYNQLVVGPNAAASLAVVANKDDLSLMARHGLIRARERELI